MENGKWVRKKRENGSEKKGKMGEKKNVNKNVNVNVKGREKKNVDLYCIVLMQMLRL